MKNKNNLTKRGKTILPAHCKRGGIKFTPKPASPAKLPPPVYLGDDTEYYHEYYYARPGVARTRRVAWLDL